MTQNNTHNNTNSAESFRIGIGNDTLSLGSGYNQISREKSNESLAQDNFNASISFFDQVINETSTNKARSTSKTDGSIGINSSFISANIGSDYGSNIESSNVIYKCVVITRKESFRLKEGFAWNDDMIDDFGTSFVSDIFYGGIIEIEVEKMADNQNGSRNTSGGVFISSSNPKSTDLKAARNFTDTMNGSRHMIKCYYSGGSVTRRPSSECDIESTISEFVENVPRNSAVVVDRAVQPFLVAGKIASAIDCYDYINQKKKECLPLFLSNDPNRDRFSNDISAILYRIKTECIDDLNDTNRMFYTVLHSYPKIPKTINDKTKPEIGIIFLGGARTGKSQLLTTAQTSFDPSFEIDGSGTKKASMKLYTLPGSHIGLIDTPGLYEIKKENHGENAKQITIGLESAQRLKICFVAKANSGNIQEFDHAVMARVSECLRSTYDHKSGGGPIIVTLIINSIHKEDMNSYTSESINKLCKSIAMSVPEFGGRLVIQQVILVAQMGREKLEKKTDKLIEFINNTAVANKLEFKTPLKAESEDREIIGAALTGTVWISTMTSRYFPLALMVAIGTTIIVGATRYFVKRKYGQGSCEFKDPLPVYALGSKHEAPIPWNPVSKKK